MMADEKVSLLRELRELRNNVISKAEERISESAANIPTGKFVSAQNLLHYLAFRSDDYRALQDRLSAVGLSSLRAVESHVLRGINNVIGLLDSDDIPLGESLPDAKAASETLKHNKCNLFSAGDTCDDRIIMVTIDAKADVDVEHFTGLIEDGMNCARINTGHDSLAEWQSAIALIKEASERVGKPCAIYLDLSGPKIRISQLHNKHGEKKNKIAVERGSQLRITEPGFEEASSKLPTIKMAFKDILKDAEPGQLILFDDGVVIARVVEKEKHAVIVDVRRTKGSKPRKLKIQNGIALPGLKLPVNAITDEDIKALESLAREINIAGISFAMSAADVKQIVGLINNYGWTHLGVVVKIETLSAFESLPEILLELMHVQNAGIMIARGDLALEVGMTRLAEVQEEILWMCEAASIPVIWATQVLDNLTREGIPSRAEITDAAMSVQAECVMLNKGAYIKESVKVLKLILEKMRMHHNKKASEMRSLELARRFYNKNRKETTF
jgi:pyruvate kinase